MTPPWYMTTPWYNSTSHHDSSHLLGRMHTEVKVAASTIEHAFGTLGMLERITESLFDLPHKNINASALGAI